MKDIAACVLTMARPQYLNKCLPSIKSCKGKDRADWYIFQDGVVNKFSEKRVVSDRDFEIASNIIDKTDLPNKTVKKNKYNEGVAKQFSKAFSLLEEGYDKVMIFEDDMVVGENAVTLMVEMLEEYPNCSPSIYKSPEYKLPDRVDMEPNVMVKCRTASFKSMGMNKEMYRDIKSRREEFMDMVDEVDYRARDHDKIKEEFGSRVSSHDSIVNKILNDKGYSRIKPALTRAIDIGAYGIHTDKGSFANRRRYSSDKITYGEYSYPEDFEVVEVDKGLF